MNNQTNNSHQKSEKKIRVCVIGGGASGLCALRHLSTDLNYFDIEAFEQTGDIGGTWVYTEKTGFDDYGLPIHTSMYRDLRSNSACEILNFPDFRKMKGLESSSAHNQVVLSYLRDYANHFQVRQFIKLYTKVENIRPEIIQPKAEETSTIWRVQLKDVKTKNIVTKRFDAVIICTGQYSEPNIPKIPGIEMFPGRILHSHSYRKPEEFSGKSVIILGASFSGTDIAVELASHADRVYLSHDGERLTSILPPSVIQVFGIDRVEKNIFFLKDGSSVNAEAFMYCTGYLVKFPFLDDTCGIRVDENFVFPLYRHTINVNYPSMCFLGINSAVVAFPMFHVKALYFMALLKKKFSLPSKEVMLEDSKLKGKSKRHAHRLFREQYNFFETLTQEAGLEAAVPPIYRKVFNVWTNMRDSNLWYYKNCKILISDDETTVELIRDPKMA